jgi:hypothetical protein
VDWAVYGRNSTNTQTVDSVCISKSSFSEKEMHSFLGRQVRTNSFFGTPYYNPTGFSYAMSTIERRLARKEKINVVTAHLELTLGQWSVGVVRFREMWNKITVFWQRSGKVQKKWSSLAFDFPTFPGNSCALCLFMAYRINVTCNESVWCDFVKQFTALRLVELFIVNLDSLTTVNITWWWLRIKWWVTESETNFILSCFTVK